MNDGKTNEMKSTMITDYNSEKIDKQKEINGNMGFSDKEPDVYTQKIHNLAGGE